MRFPKFLFDFFIFKNKQSKANKKTVCNVCFLYELLSILIKICFLYNLCIV